MEGGNRGMEGGNRGIVEEGPTPVVVDDGADGEHTAIGLSYHTKGDVPMRLIDVLPSIFKLKEGF
jgi:hypothetical protein